MKTIKTKMMSGYMVYIPLFLVFCVSACAESQGLPSKPENISGNNVVSNEVKQDSFYNGSDASKYLLFEHSTFEDFSQGLVSNSGHNMFVSRNGQIRGINWFDLNNDGYPEIVVINDHDHYDNVDGFIYYNVPGRGFRSLMPPVHQYLPGYQKIRWIEKSLESMDQLPSLGGGRVLVTDLNKDGFPEIIFTNFIHGWSGSHFPVFIYWGGADGHCRSRMSKLPSLSASGLAAADLNGNGRIDLVVSNVGREYVARSNAGIDYGMTASLYDIESDEERTSFIYWQEAYGYSIERRSELPTEYALDVAVADLNLDGHLDIIFLQGGKPGSIRIFYGNPNGIDSGKYVDLKALAPVYGSIERKFLVTDLNGNGIPDIFVPSIGDVSEIFWNSKNGFSEDNRTTLSSQNALAAAAEDLSRNGYKDLVIANNYGVSYVYWGKAEGFSEENRTDLPTNGATGVAIADLNDNGFFDIVFSNYQQGTSLDTPSFIYWGSESGYHPADRDELWGYGAVDISIGDFNLNGFKDIFLMNRQSGTWAPQFGDEVYSPTDIFIFWGNSRAKYSQAFMSTLPGVTAQADALASDLTGNGYADFVYTTNRGSVLNIFYGNIEGYSEEQSRQFDLPFTGRAVLAADLNKNGYLDIIVGSNRSCEFAVFLGNDDGFEDIKIFKFGIPQYSAAIGDIDGDGKLDLILGGHGKIKILFGTDQNLFDKKKTQIINTGMYTTRISLADFNGNGAIDIFGHHFSKADLLWENNVYSAIYWNKDGSFSADDRFELPSHGSHSGSVADVNNNGNLDILIANYNAQYSRNLDTFIYWGDKNGNFSPERMTGLPGYSPVANIVLDLNGNGYNDIVVLNHSKSNYYAGLRPTGAIHGAGSYIYWGSDDGWHIGMRDQLPTIGPHSRLIAEPGDIMRRRTYEEYTSAPIQINSVTGRIDLKIKSNHNFRQNINAFIKTADSGSALENVSWKEVELKERSIDHFLFELFVDVNVSFIQYKLQLDTGGTGTIPVILSVTAKKSDS